MQNITGVNILRVSEWILKLLYVNFLFASFTIAGLFILGFFPALTAMLTVMRKWLMGETDIPILKTFWQTYKKEFLRSNLLGMIISFFGLTLYLYYLFLNQPQAESIFWLRYPLLMISFIYILFLLYVFPVFVHYEIKIFHVLKTTFLIMTVSPLSSIMMIAGIIIIYFMFSNFPGLIPLLGASLIGFIMIWSSYLAFEHLKRKQEGILTESEF